MGPTSRSFISQRLRLHYVDWGNEGAPPLILVHGGMDHCRSWDWVAERLCGRWHVIAPDLRGHGDSEWDSDGRYELGAMIYDLAQLIHQQKLAPVTIIGHSMGGNVSLRYTGVFPSSVRRVVAVEGLGPPPEIERKVSEATIDERMRRWIEDCRSLAARQPRRYPTLAEAYARMRQENPHLTEAQALHLTRHGVRQNEDGTYSWKFDNYIRAWPPYDITRQELRSLWSRIALPALLIHGTESWASDPAADGRARYFPDATVVAIEGAGHWVHHDQLEAFLAVVEPFIAA